MRHRRFELACGFERVADHQQALVSACEAAQVPLLWATAGPESPPLALAPATQGLTSPLKTAQGGAGRDSGKARPGRALQVPWAAPRIDAFHSAVTRANEH